MISSKSAILVPDMIYLYFACCKYVCLSLSYRGPTTMRIACLNVKFSMLFESITLVQNSTHTLARVSDADTDTDTDADTYSCWRWR